MIQGLTVEQLAEQVVKDSAQKRDFYVPSGGLTFALERPQVTEAQVITIPTVAFEVNGAQMKGTLTDHAFRQVCEFGNIPAKYVDQMVKNGKLDDLVEANIQRWLIELAQQRFIRAYGAQGSNELTIRAFLSDKYKKMDYVDMLGAILPVAREAGMVVVTSRVTEKRLYIQLTVPRIKALIEQRAPSGHTFARAQSPLVVVSGSEVGAGATNIEWGIYDDFCTNGAVIGSSLRKVHLGRQYDGNGDASEFFSDDTQKLTDAALWAQVRDVVRAAVDETRFHETVAKIQGLQEIKLPDASKAIEVVGTKFGMSQDEQQAVLNSLLGSGDGATMFGLYNAVTRTAQDLPDYDRAVEFERVGGELLGINTGEIAKWRN